jgi:hypothetical protein
MQQNIFSAWVSQLVVQLPVLLALLLMLIMALVLWGRYPKACLLAFVGSLLLLVTGLLHPLASVYLIQNRPVGGSSVSLSDRFLALGLVANTVRAAAYALLTAAVFAGRTRPAVGGFPVSAPPPLPYGGMGPGAR